MVVTRGYTDSTPWSLFLSGKNLFDFLKLFYNIFSSKEICEVTKIMSSIHPSLSASYEARTNVTVPTKMGLIDINWQPCSN